MTHDVKNTGDRGDRLIRDVLSKYFGGSISFEDSIFIRGEVARCILQAVREEREACAKVADMFVAAVPSMRHVGSDAEFIAAKIRARGQ